MKGIKPQLLQMGRDVGATDAISVVVNLQLALETIGEIGNVAERAYAVRLMRSIDETFVELITLRNEQRANDPVED